MKTINREMHTTKQIYGKLSQPVEQDNFIAIQSVNIE